MGGMPPTVVGNGGGHVPPSLGKVYKFNARLETMGRRGPPPTLEKKQVQLPKTLWARLMEEAERRGTTYSLILREALEEYFARHTA